MLFVFFFGRLLLTQLLELATQVPTWWQSGRVWIDDQLPRAAELLERSGLSDRLRDTLAYLSGFDERTGDVIVHKAARPAAP